MQDRSNFSILVVDDVEAMRYAICRSLRAAGFRTVEAATGARALELAEFVSAVVLDVHLPDLLGLEVCRILRNHHSTAHLPIVQVSARYTTAEDAHAGMEAGASAYLVTPVDPGKLVAILDELLAGAAP